MTTYKDISGKFVRSVGSDPSATVGEGEIWYNTSSNTFKTRQESCMHYVYSYHPHNHDHHHFCHTYFSSCYDDLIMETTPPKSGQIHVAIKKN